MDPPAHNRTSPSLEGVEKVLTNAGTGSESVILLGLPVGALTTARTPPARTDITELSVEPDTVSLRVGSPIRGVNP